MWVSECVCVLFLSVFRSRTSHCQCVVVHFIYFIRHIGNNLLMMMLMSILHIIGGWDVLHWCIQGSVYWGFLYLWLLSKCMRWHVFQRWIVYEITSLKDAFQIRHPHIQNAAISSGRNPLCRTFLDLVLSLLQLLGTYFCTIVSYPFTKYPGKDKINLLLSFVYANSFPTMLSI